MKLLTMKCIKDPYLSKDSSPIGGRLGQEEYFVKLETEVEAHHYNDSLWGTDYDADTFNCRMKGEVGVVDEDVYYYFGLSEPEPALGEQYTDADGLVWERIK